MAKIKRERAVKEKRALKLEKKEARKQAALDARNGTPAEVAAPPEQLEGPALQDGTRALPSQRERDVQHERSTAEPGQVDDDQRQVANDEPVRKPDGIAR
jgi:hypothetical protein